MVALSNRNEDYGSRGPGFSILDPRREDNIIRLLDPRREDNIIRRLDPRRDDNLLRSTLGVDKTGTEYRRRVLQNIFAPQAAQPKSKPKPEKAPAPTRQKIKTRPAAVPQDVAPPQFGRSLEDYLGNARIEELISQIGGGYDNRINDLRRQGSEGDARIGAIYDALVNNIRGADATFEDIGNDALAQTRENTTNAAQAASLGFDQGQANLNTTLTNLGIQEAPVGDQIARAEQDATGVIGERGQIASQYITEDTKSERDYNQGIAGAAGLTGASMRAALQSDLQSALAQLADQRAQALASGRMQMFDMARNMYDADYGQWRDSQQFELGLDDRAWDRSRQAAEFDLRRQQLMAQLAPQAYEPETGYEQSAMRMQMQQIPPQAINQIMATFNSIPYDATKNPVRYADEVAAALRAAGLDERSIAVARQEAMEYFQAYRN